MNADQTERLKKAFEALAGATDVCVESFTHRRCPHCRCGREIAGETCGQWYDHLKIQGKAA